MKGPAPKIGSSSSSFRAGSGVAKNAIKTSKLKTSSLSTSNSSTSSTDEKSAEKGEQNGNGDVAKSEQEAARTFANTRPGSSADAAKKAARGKSRSQDILNQMKNGNKKGNRSPGSAYNDINSARADANDAASFQAMIKGSEATAKALADGIGKAFSGLGQIGASIAKTIEKKSGNGQQSSSGQEAAQQQQQQEAAQQSQQFAQNDGGGGADAANA